MTHLTQEKKSFQFWYAQIPKSEVGYKGANNTATSTYPRGLCFKTPSRFLKPQTLLFLHRCRYRLSGLYLKEIFYSLLYTNSQLGHSHALGPRPMPKQCNTVMVNQVFKMILTNGEHL